jgi:hypothetical protein
MPLASAPPTAGIFAAALVAGVLLASAGHAQGPPGVGVMIPNAPSGSAQMKVTLRPTRPEDLSAVIGEPLPFRIRAITVLDGDKVLGIGGIGFPPHGPVIAFVQQAPEARKYKVSFHRAGLMAMRMVRDSGVAEVVATADADDPVALAWLERLGFRPVQDLETRVLFSWRRDAIPPLD